MVKGASELVLEACSHILKFSSNEIVPIDNYIKDQINKAIKDMADQALRTICLAYKQVHPREDY